jgi:hypothetical protein
VVHEAVETEKPTCNRTKYLSQHHD